MDEQQKATRPRRKDRLKQKSPPDKSKEFESLRRRLDELEKKEAEHCTTEKGLRESEEKYRLVVNRASDGIAIIQDDVFRFVNPRLAEMGGYAVEEMIGRPFKAFLSQEEIENIRQVFENHPPGVQNPAIFEMHLRQKDGSPLFAEINTSLMLFENRPATLVIVRDFTKRKRSEKIKESIFRISEAAISSDTLEELFCSIHQVISTLMPAQNFYISLYDRASDTLSFPYFVDQYDAPPSPKKPGRGLTEYVLRTGKSLLASPEVFAELEARGEVESIGAPSIDWLGVPLLIDGRTIGVLVVQTYTEGIRYGEDEMEILKFVSGQIAMAIHRKNAEARIKASLEEKEVLLKEIHHRVKNNMQVISSVLNLQSRRISDPAVLEMFRDSQRRIRSMALVHERLYRSSDLSRIEFSTYLHNLATHLFQSCQVDSSRIRLSLDTEEVFLNINTAIPCGLITNELVSNAFKHAFPGGRAGEVIVRLRRVERDGYELRVQDTGVGFPEKLDFRRTDTLGLQIVVTLVHQLEGDIRLDRRNGTAFTLVFNELAPRKRA
ncbi:MAG: PAS domain S-box protein [Candidatus Aminicenantes bacterium]|nr:PAS domain S-box protein [Candidatus Aminicenantes bacterium]